MNTQDITMTERRAAAYKLLADCYQVPDHEVLEKFGMLKELLAELHIHPDSTTSGVGDLPDPALSSREANCPDPASSGMVTDHPDSKLLNENVDELKVDHARLFIGPFSLLAPPYGSMHLDTTEHLMTESTIQVQQWYASEGMEIDIPEVPDHIRIELEFMYYLVFREQHASGFSKTDCDSLAIDGEPNGNDPGGNTSATDSMPVSDRYGRESQYRNKQKNFLEQNLVRWIPSFTEKAAKHARTPFYRELANMTCRFIKVDYEYLCSQHSH